MENPSQKHFKNETLSIFIMRKILAKAAFVI